MLSVSVRIVINHGQDLSHALSMSLPEKDPRSLTNILRLLYESEAYFSSLASPQGVLIKQRKNFELFKD